jgi:glycosyltransferase involved in cell wall biosynthesis
VESLAHLAQRKPVVWTFHALWGVTGGCDHPRDCRRYLEVCGRCPQLGRWPLPLLDNTPTELARKIKYLAPLPLHVIAPSHWLADVVRESRVGRKWRVHHIPNAVDAAFCETLERTPRTSSAELNILIVNRNFRDEQKGFPILQSALQIAAGTLQDIPTKLVLVGENADWAAEQLPGWNCECVGYVSDTTTLARHHRAAGIFLFASPAENFPCAVLEAMAAGSCVVATPTGGVVGQIEDGVSGILATEISGPALAAALVRAATDTPLRKATGEAACARVHKLYGEAQFFARHREVYEEVLETWRPQA